MVAVICTFSSTLIMKLKLLVILFCVLVCRITLTAQPPITLYQQPVADSVWNISTATYFYNDPAPDTLDFEKIQQQKFYQLPAGYTKLMWPHQAVNTNWLKFIITNKNERDSLYVYFNVGPHQRTELFHTGMAVVQTAYPAMAEEKYFSIKLAPLQTDTFYTKIVERINYLSPIIPLLRTPAAAANSFTHQVSNGVLLLAIMCMALGSLLFMAVFAVYQYILEKDKAFIFYTAYIVCALYVWLVIGNIRFNLQIGLLQQTQFHIPISSGIAFFYALFIAHLLQLPSKKPVKWKILKWLLLLILVETAIEIVENVSGRFLFHSSFYYHYILPLPNNLINLFLLYVLITYKGPVKKYLLAGLVLLILFLFVFSNFVYFIPNLPAGISVFANFPPFWGLMGVTAEAVCFAMALAYKSKLVKDERNNLQASYTNELQQKLLEQKQEMDIQFQHIQQQQARQLETAFEKKLAETEMAALRAQMNPHFIFNCLNSIKLYTLENDAETASDYLTKFSRLIRLVLENAKSEKIILAKEVETLRLYIELEMMRFKNKLTYNMIITPAVEEQYLELPPLLLQPYVENAIWHGLMHKKEGGNVTIEFIQPGENLLEVVITDNGIGREKAAALKSKESNRHKSFGINMTNERLQVINQLYAMQAKVTITDLYDTHHAPAGTRVVIIIPV